MSETTSRRLKPFQRAPSCDTFSVPISWNNNLPSPNYAREQKRGWSLTLKTNKKEDKIRFSSSANYLRSDEWIKPTKSLSLKCRKSDPDSLQSNSDQHQAKSAPSVSNIPDETAGISIVSLEDSEVTTQTAPLICANKQKVPKNVTDFTIFVTSPVSTNQKTLCNVNTSSNSSQNPSENSSLVNMSRSYGELSSCNNWPMERRGSLSIGRNEDATLYQINKFIFLSSIDAAYNELILCKFEIDKIIDVTNTHPENIPRHRKIRKPCNCPLKKHSRPKLILGIENSETEIVEPCFEEVNRFIEAARERKQRVLIISYDGNSRCALIAMQYLIAYDKYTFDQAFAQVKRQNPSVAINVGFRKALQRWEKRHKNPRRLKSDLSLDLGSSTLNSFVV